MPGAVSPPTPVQAAFRANEVPPSFILPSALSEPFAFLCWVNRVWVLYERASHVSQVRAVEAAAGGPRQYWLTAAALQLS